MKEYRVLNESQIEHFLRHGYVKVEGCIPRRIIEEWVNLAFKRIGYDPDDPSSWVEVRVNAPQMNKIPVRELSPRAFGAICDLVGGENRLHAPAFAWGDGFIINFSYGVDRPWEPPSPAIDGWHKDGDFFRHFLDSPEQGLLCIVVWSDIQPRSGGTFVACDSVRHVARRLYRHPEGLSPGGFGALIEKCGEFFEVTGRAGDVILLHPFILHAISQNPSGRPRFITNPCIKLKEPMNFNRELDDDLSPVENTILRALEFDRLNFQITAPRERIIPERIARQKRLLEEQEARLAAAGRTAQG